MCGVVGVHGSPGAAQVARNAMHLLQSRGQEACGLGTQDEGNIRLIKDLGLVRSVLHDGVLAELPGQEAVGHTRYATCGQNTKEDAQPHLIKLEDGTKIMGATNGDIPNYQSLREELVGTGVELKSNNDGELIIAYIAHFIDQGQEILDAIKNTMAKFEGGAFSGVLLTPNTLWAFRDPHGFRPLSMARLQTGYIIASESCAFNIVGADFIRDIFPGAITRIDKEGARDFVGVKEGNLCLCDFELVYFGRPDSRIFGYSVSDVRKKLGAGLWELAHIEADVVGSIPDSANAYAIGFAHASGISYDNVLIRHHSSGREFIEGSQEIRDTTAKYKHSPDPAVVRGKRVVLVDDSIVRGTTIRKRVRMVRLAGAREVHVRIGSPPVVSSCFHGIDTPDPQEFIANRKDLRERQAFFEADSLIHHTQESYEACLPGNPDNYCRACFTGKYPVDVSARQAP